MQNGGEMQIVPMQSKRMIAYAQWGLQIALYGVMLGGMQEIYTSWLDKQVGPGIIRLLTIEIGGISRVLFARYLPDMKKTLLPECILLSLNTIQLAQYVLYEVLQ